MYGFSSLTYTKQRNYTTSTKENTFICIISSFYPPLPSEEHIAINAHFEARTVLQNTNMCATDATFVYCTGNHLNSAINYFQGTNTQDNVNQQNI
jgi:hypothetical protein